MIAYRLLRALARIALRWFYRDIEVEGAERLPGSGPVLLAANHPNALVDALIVGVVVSRPVTLTAKATLYEHAALRPLLRAVGIIPLRRASDDIARSGAPPDPSRNVAAFGAIHDRLADGGAVLLFPEGKSHSEPALAPLRSGLARIALQARDERAIRGLVIMPIGLTFEHKWEPRSRVLVRVGELLAIDAWRGGAEALMAEVDTRLRAVTLNFPSADDADAVLRISRTLSGILDAPRPLGAPLTPLATEADIARRVAAVRASLAAFPSPLADQATHLTARLDAFMSVLAAHRIPPGELGIATGVLPGLRFALRELSILVLAGPLAWWGRLNHWLSLHLARRIAQRMSRHPDDPAMFTIVAGLVIVSFAYLVQTAVVWQLAGSWWALPYLLSLPPSATWDLRLRDRIAHARRRMDVYRLLRRDPALSAWLRVEAQWLRQAAAILERNAERMHGLGEAERVS